MSVNLNTMANEHHFAPILRQEKLEWLLPTAFICCCCFLFLFFFCENISFIEGVVLFTSSVGNTKIGTTVSMSKPIKHGHGRSPVSDVPVSARYNRIVYVDTWIVRGPLGWALCKLLFVFTKYLQYGVYSEFNSKAVDRFGAVVFPLARNLVEHPEKLVCEIRWKEMFEEFSFPRSCCTTAQSVVLFTCLSPLWPPCTLS